MNEREKYLKLAIKLAKKGLGYTNPNPLVGAVIVKNGNIVGKGYHQGYGLPHAEINALRKAKERAKGATLYLNLEPCCFFGKTPPCTTSIISAGIKEVVTSLKDPNPKVSGRGISQLKKAGIRVEIGILKKEARKLNEAYLKYITTKKPFVTLKAAMSLDGKIATKTGESKWITSKVARNFSHQLRLLYDGILVGIGTVLKDNPYLNYTPTYRGFHSPRGSVSPGLRRGGKRFTKVIVDSSAKIPLDANLLKKSKTCLPDRQVILATTKMASIDKLKKLNEKGIEILILGENRKVDLLRLMEELGKRELANLLIEGGGEINEAALRLRIVDKVCFFVSPKIIGGRYAKTPVEGEGIEHLNEAILLKELTCEPIGEDFLVEGYVYRTD
ncbi:MAG: bifunctional diaminohydroxyphosphoribosylaminopyrimidine deaminase/5-amino-6-(5-phosphoribosylamino)uracil reductase RibD [Candidatus Omnitrophica bacterium]|nr:bifunctional diaminohydroxyphosphoribosylaminopyrimidine deaminase/5-amino-6-(5-phosphoribosylamino)uracil reductase RibD [Candidatus Omnitrophota bacterium]